MEEKIFCSEVDLERHYGIGRSTWRRYRESGNGPAFNKLGNRVLYKLADVTAWIETHAKKSTSEYVSYQKGRPTKVAQVSS